MPALFLISCHALQLADLYVTLLPIQNIEKARLGINPYCIKNFSGITFHRTSYKYIGLALLQEAGLFIVGFVLSAKEKDYTSQKSPCRNRGSL